MRIDALLAHHIADYSRSQLKTFIEKGNVSLAGEITTDPSIRIKQPETITITVAAPEQSWMKAEEIPLDVVYEDDDLIVINKPSGMVVHPAPGSKDATLVNALLAHCGDSLSDIGGVLKPGIVHRIDKGTSGLLVVAKNNRAHMHLSEQFKEHTIQRVYKALVWGELRHAKNTIEGNIGRSTRDRKKMALLAYGGREAITHYKRLATYHDMLSYVECTLETGRTHQIRVHMSSIKHSLLGDKTYGRSRVLKKHVPSDLKDAISELDRPWLHAEQLGFEHPTSGENLFFTCKIPEELDQILKKLEEWKQCVYK